MDLGQEKDLEKPETPYKTIINSRFKQFGMFVASKKRKDSDTVFEDSNMMSLAIRANWITLSITFVVGAALMIGEIALFSLLGN